jgi:hypothetical protein
MKNHLLMKNILKLEELAMFLVSAYALYLLKVDWWVYLLLLLGPDISMFAYMAGNSMGAAGYNLFHHKGLALVLFAAGYLMPDNTLQVAGIILFGHASLDRSFGYGLKLNKGFKHTHLGMIGKKD